MLIAEIVVRGTLVALATLAVHGVMRRRSPAARHRVLVVGLVALAALPLQVVSGPRWRPVIGAAKPNPPSDELLRAMEAIPEWRVSRASAIDDAAPQLPSRVFAPRVSEAVVLFVALAGTCLCLVMRLAGEIRVRRVVSRAGRLAPQSSLMVAARIAASELGLRRSYRIVESAECTVPFTAGILRPTVVIPRGFGTRHASATRAVLLHELAHVRRGDVLTRLVADVACALNWFNPLVWLSARTSAADAEYACDDLVVQSRVDPASYAEQLVSLARGMRGRRMFEASVGVARAGLATRVDRLLGSRPAPAPARAGRDMLPNVSLIVASIALAAVTPRFAAPQFGVSGASTMNISNGGPEISSNAAGLQARWVIKGRHTGLFITGMVNLDDVLTNRAGSEAGSLVIAQESDRGLLTYAWPNADAPPPWVREALRVAPSQLRGLPEHGGGGQPAPRAETPRPPRVAGSVLSGTPALSDDPSADVVQAGWVDDHRRVGVFMRGRWTVIAGRPVSDDASAWLDAFVWDSGRLTRLTITRPRGDVESRMLRENQAAVVDDAALLWAARLVEHVNAARLEIGG